MDAKDLMIGDWVEVTQTECVADGGHYITWSEYGKVVGITDSYIEVEVRDGEYNVDAHEDELKPIPLTPEILEQNGFEMQRDKSELGTLDTYWLGSELGAFRIHRLNNGDYQFGLAKIKFVHQLQHALRLCGINKEIKV